MLKLVKFIRENENWEELLSNAPYFIKISRDDGYIMFKYSQIESDFSNEIVKECRGLILRESDFEPVCVPFFKFMNAEEPNSDLDKIDWSTATVQQKIDGSLIKVWFDNNKWHISTNGTIDAFKAPIKNILTDISSYGELFVRQFTYGAVDSFEKLCSLLDEDYTYMFELITEYNRVVVEPDHYDLSVYILGCRNNKTLLEKDLYGSYLNQCIGAPKRYNLHSYNDVRVVADNLDWCDEGFVVCDCNFNRVKIKSPAYVRAHFARNNGSMSYERLLEVLLIGEKNEFLTYASDYREVFEKVENSYYSIIEEVKKTIEEMNPESFETRKDFALAVRVKPVWMQGFLFAYDRLDDFIKNVRPAKWIEFMKARGDIND